MKYPDEFTYMIDGYYTNIVDGSVTVNVQRGTASDATCSFYCRFQDQFAVATYLLTANNQTVGVYGMMLGAVHPIYTQFFCDDVKIEMVGENITETTWPYVKLNCTYRPRVFEFGSPTIIREESLRITGQVLTIPGAMMTYGGTPSSSPDTLYYPLLQYSVKVFNVTTLPLSTVLTCMNTVNSNTLTIQLGGSGTFSVPAGYALYEGIGDTSRTITLTGGDNWTITHTWLISPIKHNLIFVPELLNTVTSNITTNIVGSAAACFVMPDQPKYLTQDHSALGV